MFEIKSGTMVLTIIAILVVAGFASASDIDQDREINIEVIEGTTEKMQGGDLIAVKAGDLLFAVVYGTENNPNGIILLTEQRRYLGGADVYSVNDDLLRRQGISIDLLFAQKLVAMIEFIDMDNDSLFDLRWLNDETHLPDKPVKAASLIASWELKNLRIDSTDTATSVHFDITTSDLPYTWVWPSEGLIQKRGANPSDGVIEEVTFTFHIRLAKENTTIQMVPWYRVEVDGRHIVNSNFMEYKNYSSQVLNGTIKYDHYIEGWDFISNETKLAVESHIIAGIHVNGMVNHWIRERFANMRCEVNSDTVINENGTGPESPLMSRDSLNFRNNWERFGRISWISNVTVDNTTQKMMFQLQSGGILNQWHNGRHFIGFWFLAAFLYPAGDVIFHDPLFASEASTLSIPTTANAFPQLMNIIQLAAVILAAALAILISVYLRRREKGIKKTPLRRDLLKPEEPEMPRPIQPPRPPELL